MWDRLRKYAQDSGFLRLMTDAENGIAEAYIRQDEKGCYLLFLSKEPEKMGWNKENYQSWRREIEQEVFHRGQRIPICLGILCVENTYGYREWCEEGQTWLLDMGSGRVIRYENQMVDFLGWEHSLEDVLMAGNGEISKRQRKQWYIPFVTVTLLTVNVLIFVVQELFLSEELSLQMYTEGAMYWPAVQEAGQYYRLITSMFLHYDTVHLMNNMLILYMIGSRLEELIGRTRFVIVYFVSGILAGLTSMGYNILQERLVISVGASGAVFGIVGALLWVVIAHRGRVQGLTGRQMLFFAALSLYGGFANQQTDNAAHLGGLVAGLLLMILLYRRKQAGAEMERR